MKEKIVGYIKKTFNKRVGIAIFCALVLLIVGVLSHLISAKMDYPYVYHYYVMNELVSGDIPSSFNFSSLMIFKWLIAINNNNVTNIVNASQTLFIGVLSILYLTLSYLIYQMLRKKSLYSYILIEGALLLLVFTTSNQFYHLDSILLPLSVITAIIATALLVSAIKKENLVYTIVVSIFVLAIAFIFGNVLLMISLFLCLANIIYKIIKNKKIDRNNIILLIAITSSMLIYFVYYLLLGKKLTSLDFNHGEVRLLSTYIKNFALAITGPSYQGNLFSSTIRLLIGVGLLGLNVLIIIILIIKYKKFSNNIAYFVLLLFISLIYTFMNRKSYLLVEKPYFIFSIMILILTLYNITTFFNDFAFYQKFKEETKFLISNVFYAVLLIIPLFNYGYATRNNDFLQNTLWSFIKEDMETDEYGLTAVGLNEVESERYCKYLYKNRCGDYSDLTISNKVQESSFIYGSNDIKLPFNIEEHYWFPQTVHALLDSKNGNTFSCKIRVEDDQIGTYCHIYIDQTMVSDIIITSNDFNFVFEGLNKNEVYGIRIEVGKAHNDPTLPSYPHLGFQLYEMEII